jgi:hypothetical protein
MLALGLFYFLLLLLIILIIYMILLFDDYTSRTLVPPLLNSYYGTNSDGQSPVDGYYKLYLTDGVSVHNSSISGVSGSLDFGASGASKNPIEFMPNYEDRTRPINGVFKLLLASSEADGQGVCFRITDNTEEIVKDASYYIENHSQGVQEVVIPFSSKDFRDQSQSTDKFHKFEFYGASVGGTSILNNTLLINSMYVTYY